MNILKIGTARRLIDEEYIFKNTENVTPETQKRILDAFEIFDHDHNKTVDAREIGTIIRFLGQSFLIFYFYLHEIY